MLIAKPLTVTQAPPSSTEKRLDQQSTAKRGAQIPTSEQQGIGEEEGNGSAFRGSNKQESD